MKIKAPELLSYAGTSRLSTALGILVLIAAIALAHLAITSPNGDVSGGWTLNAEQVRIGITRTIVQAWPYAVLILAGSIMLAYASLKWYDEPVRKWLRKKLG